MANDNTPDDILRSDDESLRPGDEIRRSDIRRSDDLRGVPPAPGREVADDRAQPGDVLGIERQGERTHLGETAEDEDRRREDAEKAARDRRDT
jgi:hypothetical protein